MKKFPRLITLFSCIVALCFWIGSCSAPKNLSPVVLNIAAAGIFRDVIANLGEEYQKQQPNIAFNYTIASAGLLQKRIEEGEYFDIFLIASSKRMDALQNQGLLLSDTRKNLVSTEMVLIASADSKFGISDFKDLGSDRIKTVAISTERLDAGIYAKQILTHLGIFHQIQRKAVWADFAVREIRKLVENKQADVGITFMPEAKGSDKVKILAKAPINSYQPIITLVAILKNSQHIPEAKALIDFLTSPKAMLIFENQGFARILSSPSSSSKL